MKSFPILTDVSGRWRCHRRGVVHQSSSVLSVLICKQLTRICYVTSSMDEDNKADTGPDYSLICCSPPIRTFHEICSSQRHLCEIQRAVGCGNCTMLLTPDISSSFDPNSFDTNWPLALRRSLNWGWPSTADSDYLSHGSVSLSRLRFGRAMNICVDLM